MIVDRIASPAGRAAPSPHPDASPAPRDDDASGSVAQHGWSAACDWWHRALDRQRVVVGAEPWLLQVVAIHTDAAELWIQLQAAEDALRTLVLRVTTGTTLDVALRALAGATLAGSLPCVIDARPPTIGPRAGWRAAR